MGRPLTKTRLDLQKNILNRGREGVVGWSVEWEFEFGMAGKSWARWAFLAGFRESPFKYLERTHVFIEIGRNHGEV